MDGDESEMVYLEVEHFHLKLKRTTMYKIISSSDTDTY